MQEVFQKKAHVINLGHRILIIRQCLQFSGIITVAFQFQRLDHWLVTALAVVDQY